MEFRINQEQLQIIHNFMCQGIYNLNAGDIMSVFTILGQLPKIEPAEDKPAEDKPVEDKPVEDKPVEDKPAEDKPVEDKPAEDKPAEDEAK